MLLKRLPELLDQLNEASRALAGSETTPDAVERAVTELRNARTEEDIDALGELDPYLVQALDRGLLAAWEALQRDDPRDRRRTLRLALEQARQALRDLADETPVSEARTAKEVARWLNQVTGWSQQEAADLLGVDRRQLQRWVSAAETTTPRGEDARRLRVVARVVAHLRHAMTGPGVAAWLQRPHPTLGGAAPTSLLLDAEATPRLIALAAAARSQCAA